MIQIYRPDNNNYEYNGDCILQPEFCELQMKINDAWILTLINPIDENFKYIVEDATISVNTPFGKKQLFVISEIEKTDDSVTATAIPFFLKNDGFYFDTRIVDKTGQQAMDILFENSSYKGYSDITRTSTAYYELKNVCEVLTSENENSFLNRWGGEVLYKNSDIIINERIGEDRGMRVEFGFNLLGVSETVNTESIITKIVPKSYNGYILPDKEMIISENENKYKHKFYPKVIEYNDVKLKEDASEGDEEKGVIVCDTLNELYEQLRCKAKNEYTVNKIDMPKITYEVEIADISKTELYKDYQNLVNVSLGDTVHVKHRRLNIETEARVIEITYDCIAKKAINLIIGDYTQSFFDNTSKSNNAIGKVIDTGNETVFAEKVKGVINMLQTTLHAQRDISKKQDVRAIVFEDLDEGSTTYGALGIGTQGIQIAKKRNETNSGWVWGTAINYEGIMAKYVITGTLSDKQGLNTWDLDTGELKTKKMKAKDAEIEGKITSKSGSIGNWEITERGIQSVYVRTMPQYTENDRQKIKKYILGEISLSESEIDYLDVSWDGFISSMDYTLITDLISGVYSRTWKYTYRIDSSTPASFITCEVDRGNGRVLKDKVSIPSITLENIRNIGKRLQKLELDMLKKARS